MRRTYQVQAGMTNVVSFLQTSIYNQPDSTVWMDFDQPALVAAVAFK